MVKSIIPDIETVNNLIYVILYEDNNRLTVIEEFVSGSSLREKIDTNDLSEASILRYMCNLCEILENLHSVTPPIVHRDIKPSNIIITNYEHVMLLDFNVAKYFADADTADTILIGIKGYAAPEQYGFGSSTPQTDIYTLGILLKELLKSLPESIGRFDKIINMYTQMNPADRFQSVAELKRALQNAEDSIHPNNSNSSAWKFFLPPGYRTGTPWKISLSSISYLFIFWLSLTTEFKDTAGFKLWLNRFFCLMILLSVVFCSFNYCNVQRLIPLCRHQNRILHYIGILILDIIVVIYFFVILVIIESTFFS